MFDQAALSAILGVVLCLAQSALFSGLNLGLFGVSRLRLEVQAERGNRNAQRVLGLRRDAHFLLTTILWGNVSVNVLLTLITESLLAGVGAFLFSTVGITIFAEIFPQAYFSRKALGAGALLVPMVRFYQILLYPVAKPTALLLDAMLGKEPVDYFKESEVAVFLRQHAEAANTDMEALESQGAVNFLALDDIRVDREGEVLDPASILALPTPEGSLPTFPAYRSDPKDPFLQKVHAAGKKWVVLTDEKERPQLVLDAHSFLRDVLCDSKLPSPYAYCHRPIIVNTPHRSLGEVIGQLKVNPQHAEDDVVDNDLILYWGIERKIITGADILGRLLRGIVEGGARPG